MKVQIYHYFKMSLEGKNITREKSELNVAILSPVGNIYMYYVVYKVMKHSNL